MIREKWERLRCWSSPFSLRIGEGWRFGSRTILQLSECQLGNGPWNTEPVQLWIVELYARSCVYSHRFTPAESFKYHLQPPVNTLSSQFHPIEQHFLRVWKKKNVKSPRKKKKTVHWSSRLLFTYTVTPIKQELNYCWSPWQSEPLAPVVSARLCSCLATCGTAAHWSVPNLREFRSLHRTSITW